MFFLLLLLILSYTRGLPTYNGSLPKQVAGPTEIDPGWQTKALGGVPSVAVLGQWYSVASQGADLGWRT